MRQELPSHAKLAFNSIAFFILAFNFVFLIHEVGLVVAGSPMGREPVVNHSPFRVVSPGVIRFVNGKWFDGRFFVSKQFYSVNGILREDFHGQPDTTIDLAQRFVIPPFADAHNHHFADGMDYRSQIATYFRHGIFYVKNPNNTLALTAPIRPYVNQPASIDVAYANGGLTASGGHPIQIYEGGDPHGHGSGAKSDKMKNQAYFVVDDTLDLVRAWPNILAGKPDFIKVYLEYSEEYDIRKDDPEYFGRRGLNPALLPAIVTKSHQDNLRVTAHVNTVTDFRFTIAAGVDEIAHVPLQKISPEDAAAAAESGAVVVTTTMSHRPTAHIKDIDEIHRHNLQLLQHAGVMLALGTDDSDRTVLEEAANLNRLEVFDNLTLLKLWVENTPATIFPQRKIGRLKEGYEASFVVLDANPLAELRNVTKVHLRCKQGNLIVFQHGGAGGFPKISIADTLSQIIAWEDAESAIAQYHQLRRERPQDFDFAESRLNELGYKLLRSPRNQEAIAVLQLNTQVYPHSANAYDSLADAYRAVGKRQLARECYKKVLMLLPNNREYSEDLRRQLESNAKKGLREL